MTGSNKALVGWAARALLLGMSLPMAAAGEPPVERQALVLRFVHPEVQAAEVLRLFEGARAPDPAAALAAWKRATREPAQLGKPLEAVISLFNPEMVREWKVMHQAEVGLGIRAADGKARWYAIVPHDDGTLAAGVTAQRLSGGAGAPPLESDGQTFTIERLGPPAAVMALQAGNAVLIGSTREELIAGLHRFRRSGEPRRPADGPAVVDETTDTGVYLDFDPALLDVSQASSVNVRRAVTLIRGLESGAVRGRLALGNGRLGLETTSSNGANARFGPGAVNQVWLRWVPEAVTLGFMSAAVPSDRAFWNWAFALADRVDRVDPAHADAAPFRTRVNLLATGAGVKLETDLWPHLRGLTAALVGDRAIPGKVTGALVVLHLDDETSVQKLMKDTVPRLAALRAGKQAAPARAENVPANAAVEFGHVGGKALAVTARGQDLVLGWGDDVLARALECAKTPERSVSPLCTGALRSGKTAPQRLGAIWPGRCWSPSRTVDATTPAWNVLAQGPPAVWCGWDGPAGSRDSIEWSGLHELVCRFLDQVPLNSPPAR